MQSHKTDLQGKNFENVKNTHLHRLEKLIGFYSFRINNFEGFF